MSEQRAKDQPKRSTSWYRCYRCGAETTGANNVCADCAAEMGLDRL